MWPKLAWFALLLSVAAGFASAGERGGPEDVVLDSNWLQIAFFFENPSFNLTFVDDGVQTEHWMAVKYVNISETPDDPLDNGMGTGLAPPNVELDDQAFDVGRSDLPEFIQVTQQGNVTGGDCYMMLCDRGYDPDEEIYRGHLTAVNYLFLRQADFVNEAGEQVLVEEGGLKFDINIKEWDFKTTPPWNLAVDMDIVFSPSIDLGSDVNVTTIPNPINPDNSVYDNVVQFTVRPPGVDNTWKMNFAQKYVAFEEAGGEPSIKQIRAIRRLLTPLTDTLRVRFLFAQFGHEIRYDPDISVVLTGSGDGSDGDGGGGTDDEDQLPIILLASILPGAVFVLLVLAAAGATAFLLIRRRLYNNEAALHTRAESIHL